MKFEIDYRSKPKRDCKGRCWRPVNAIDDEEDEFEYVKEDVVQSRILWLSGLEENINKGEGIDSFSRYIYIHGTPEEWLLGSKASKGCIRMSNKDVIDLFDRVQIGMTVYIK